MSKQSPRLFLCRSLSRFARRSLPFLVRSPCAKIKGGTFAPSFLVESKTLRVSNAEKGAPHLFLMVLPPFRRHNHFALVRIPCAKIKDGTFVPSFSGGEQGIRTLEYSLKHYTISNRAPSASSDNSPYLKIFPLKAAAFHLLIDFTIIYPVMSSLILPKIQFTTHKQKNGDGKSRLRTFLFKLIKNHVMVDFPLTYSCAVIVPLVFFTFNVVVENVFAECFLDERVCLCGVNSFFQ